MATRKPIQYSRYSAALLIGGFSLSGLITALFIGWLILVPLDFRYGFWHDHAGIGWAIDRYGPENRYKKGFATLPREERLRLFGEINDAVQNGGKGLREIQFHAEGYPPQRLLRMPEWIHLQDVANLIDRGKYVVYPALIMWLGLIVFFACRQFPPPPLRKQLLSLLGVIGIITVVVLIIGPTKVFSYMHEVVFPDGHQWFFYYQDSLMSTMMWAPRLFGWIAIEWVALTVVIYALIQWIAAKIIRIAQTRLQIEAVNTSASTAQ